jgi:hypothetical protein
LRSAHGSTSCWFGTILCEINIAQFQISRKWERKWGIKEPRFSLGRDRKREKFCANHRQKKEKTGKFLHLSGKIEKSLLTKQPISPKIVTNCNKKVTTSFHST